MSESDGRADTLELKVLSDHQLRQHTRPKWMDASCLRFGGKESALGGESKKDGRTQPDRCVQYADKSDHEDHGLTLRKTQVMCQAVNALVTGAHGIPAWNPRSLNEIISCLIAAARRMLAKIILALLQRPPG